MSRVSGFARDASPAEAAARPQQAEDHVMAFDRKIDGLLSGERWSGGKVSYCDPDRASDYARAYASDDDEDGLAAPRDGFSPFSAQQLRVAKTALDADALGELPGHSGFSVEGFTGLAVTYSGPGSASGTIRLANSHDPAGPANTAYAIFPASHAEGGDAWFDTAGARPEAGDYDYLAITHEIGHALGLKHGHEPGLFDALPAAMDSLEFSAMTYRTYVGDRPDGYESEAFGFPQTYMMLDVAALQHMYGADFETRADDTTYAWDPRTGRTYVDGALALDPGANRVFLTVWDGGGRDTYDVSAYRKACDIDLAPGSHSTFASGQLAHLGGGPNGGKARGNVFNALLYHDDPRSLIENVKGGAGGDTVFGNEARNLLVGNDGRDRLYGLDGTDRLKGGEGGDRLTGGLGPDHLAGGGGLDVLVGGPGRDTFVFRDPSDFPDADRRDVIRGGGDSLAFDGAGAADGDRIDLSGLDADTTRDGDQTFEFGDSGTGCVRLTGLGADTLVCANTDADRAFELQVLIADGAERPDAYTAGDFLL